MGKKFLAFKGKKPELLSKGPSDSSDGEIVDHGTLGNLKYELYKRGVLKIFEDKSSLIFKKDIYKFEDEIAKLNFEEMGFSVTHTIKGSGDNDHLVFSKNDQGDIEISLKKREFSSIEILRDIIAKGKKKLDL